MEEIYALLFYFLYIRLRKDFTLMFETLFEPMVQGVVNLRHSEILLKNSTFFHSFKMSKSIRESCVKEHCYVRIFSTI